MYDTLVRSTIFGVRNADKVVNTADKGRIAADVGQFTNAVKTAAQLDNSLGKGAQAAINVMGKAANKYKAIEIAGKGAEWASRHVNPLLIGAAGYRVLTAENKEKALKREIFGMSAMFGGEYLMKEFFKSNTMANFRAGIKNKYLRIGLGILEGILFVGGSILSSNIGYKFADKLNEISSKNTHKEINDISKELKEETAKLEKVKTEIAKNTTIKEKVSTDTQKPLVA